jgi:hypothetical protein
MNERLPAPRWKFGLVSWTECCFSIVEEGGYIVGKRVELGLQK